MVCKLHSGKTSSNLWRQFLGCLHFYRRLDTSTILSCTLRARSLSQLPSELVSAVHRRWRFPATTPFFFFDSSSLSSSPLFTLPPYLQLPVTPRKEKVKEKNDTDEEAIDAENHRDSRRGSNLIHHAQPKSPSHSRLLSAFSKTVTSLFDFPRHLPLADRIVFVVSWACHAPQFLVHHPRCHRPDPIFRPSSFYRKIFYVDYRVFSFAIGRFKKGGFPVWSIITEKL